MIDPAALRHAFDRAVSLPPQDRALFLDSACGGDGALRREVERLLSADAGGASAFDDASSGSADTSPDTRATHGAALLPSGTPLGPYVIDAPIGAGGMGQVYRARDTRLGRTVAIKVLPPGLAGDPQARQRFEREARAVAALSHPHICPLFDVGRQDTIDFLVMEYLTGETLANRLQRGRLGVRDALTLAGQIAAALAAAHRAGIVHRDLKPGNIMLTEAGAKLLDFGLARHTEPRMRDAAPTSMADPLTGIGMILGTLPYMAPEQIEGRPADARTDIFAFGIVFYEMLTGRRAFEGQTQASVISAILREEAPTLPPDVAHAAGPDVESFVRRCLAKRADARWPSTEEMLATLRRIADRERYPSELRTATGADRQGIVWSASQEVDVATSHPPGGDGPATSRLNTRRQTYRRVIAAAVILCAVGAVWWYVRRHWSDATSQTQAKTASPAAAQPRIEPRPLHRLTFDPGLQTDATWSPDGQSIAYTSDKAGNFDIWIQRTDGGDARQVTASRFQETEPTWSPDGGSIIFRSDRAGGGLYMVPAVGGPERQLTSFGVRPRWSPDGSQVLFASTGLPGSFAPLLYTVSIDGAAPRQVLQPVTRNLGAVLDWKWHPDSRRVSVLGITGDLERRLYTAPLSGDPSTVFDTKLVGGNWAEVEWAPSGTALYVSVQGNWSEIVKFTVDPQTMKVTSTERVTASDQYHGSASVSPDGKRLALTMSRRAVQLWSMPFDAATGRLAEAGEPVTPPDVNVLESDLSADGSRIVYRISRVGSVRDELWTSDLLTGRRRRLTADDQQRHAAVWSKDGHRLAYLWWHDPSGRYDGRSGQYALAIRRMDTDEEQMIMAPRGPRSFYLPFLTEDWSPDGEMVLASSHYDAPGVRTTSAEQVRSSLDLWPVRESPRAETATIRVTSDTDSELWESQYSPDGKWIAFVSADRRGAPGTAVIFTVPSGGATRQQWVAVTNQNHWADKPRWSPDGSVLYYTLWEGRFWNVWARRFDTRRGLPVGVPFRVTQFNTARRQLSQDFGPAQIGIAAKRLTVTVMEQTGSVWLVDAVDQQ